MNRLRDPVGWHASGRRFPSELSGNSRVSGISNGPPLIGASKLFPDQNPHLFLFSSFSSRTFLRLDNDIIGRIQLTRGILAVGLDSDVTSTGNSSCLFNLLTVTLISTDYFSIRFKFEWKMRRINIICDAYTEKSIRLAHKISYL